jgi:hypothetical protein
MDWQDPSIDELWEECVKSAGETDALRRQWLEKEIYPKVRELRRGHDFMTHVEILVVVPICDACMHFEYRGYEEPKPVPDICGRLWRYDYRVFGMKRNQIMLVAGALSDGDWKPRCWRCGSKIDLANGESFCTQSVGFSEFFGQPTTGSKRIPDWMKEIVRDFFGRNCAACGQEANTIDHIVSHAKGGQTEVVNLQPLCERCNIQKADKYVETVTITLNFPLRPPPSGESDLFIW